MAPSAHAFDELIINAGFAPELGEHLLPQSLLQHFGRDREGDVWGLPTGNFFVDVINIHSKMFTSNVSLAAGHPDSSPWWAWPLMHTPVFYWVPGEARLYLFGNPITWWTVSVMLVVVLVNLALFRVCDLEVASGKEQKPALWLPIVGFVSAYAPLSQVTRVLFLYHYFTALVFSIISVVLWLDYVGWIRANGLAKQRISVYAYIMLIVVGFISVSPVTYGFGTGTWLVDYFVEIFPKWRQLKLTVITSKIRLG